MRRVLRSAPACALLVAACGDFGLLDAEYAGLPLGWITGTITLGDPLAPPPTISVALLWTPNPTLLEPLAETCTSTNTSIAHPLRTISIVPTAIEATDAASSFLLVFALPIRHLPPDELLATGSDGRTFALGVIVAFSDDDADGLFDPDRGTPGGDRVLAVSRARIIYVPGEGFAVSTVDDGPIWSTPRGTFEPFDTLIPLLIG